MSIAAPDDRRRELAQIHIAKKQLDIDDTTYRCMLRAIGRVESAADLGAEGRRQVLAHLKARGFKPKVGMKAHRSGQTTPWDWVNHAAPDRQATLRKIAVMLKHASGREKAYADAIAKNMFGIERVEFCAPDQLRRIVGALEYDRRRRARRAEKAAT
jgi:phage gp16-like protein